MNLGFLLLTLCFKIKFRQFIIPIVLGLITLKGSFCIILFS